MHNLRSHPLVDEPKDGECKGAGVLLMRQEQWRRVGDNSNGECAVSEVQRGWVGVGDDLGWVVCGMVSIVMV